MVFDGFSYFIADTCFKHQLNIWFLFPNQPISFLVARVWPFLGGITLRRDHLQLLCCNNKLVGIGGPGAPHLYHFSSVPAFRTEFNIIAHGYQPRHLIIFSIFSLRPPGHLLQVKKIDSSERPSRPLVARQENRFKRKTIPKQSLKSLRKRHVYLVALNEHANEHAFFGVMLGPC